MHKKEDIENIVREVLNLSTDVKITMDTSLKSDLGMDSLDLIEIALKIEENLDDILSDDVLQNVVTFGDLMRLINTK